LTCSFAFAENSNFNQSDDVGDNKSSSTPSITNSQESIVNNTTVSSTGQSSVSSNTQSSVSSSSSSKSDTVSSSVSSSSSSKSNTISSSSSTFKAAGQPTKLSQAAIFKASRNVKNFVLRNNRLPNFVTISGYKFSIPEYMHLVSRAISLRDKKSKSLVTIKWNIRNPSKPSGVNIRRTLSKSNYLTISKRVSNFISKNNRVPNFITIKQGRIHYQTVVYGLARVGDFIHVQKQVPKTLTLNVPKNHKLNKFMPNYNRSSASSNSVSTPSISSKYKISGDKNGIWLHGWDSLKIDNAEMDRLIKFGIKNIFVIESFFTIQGEARALSWIKNATRKGMKIHIWVPVFYNGTSKTWVNPIKDGKLNQAFFDTIISKSRKYAAIDGVVGIHLDYLRYPGTAYKHKYSGGSGADAVTEFTRQLSVAVRKVKPNIVVSAAVMPETSLNPYYYGQDIPKLGKHLDVIIPMIYKGNYNAKTPWIKSTTDWFVKNSGGAEIWGGLQSYVSDSNINRLSVSALTADTRAVFDGGAPGVVFFRWGLTNFFNLFGL